MRAILLSCLLGAAELIAAQSLPSCAQTCASQTKVKCKASDFTCACLSEKYVNKLATCFWKTCNEADNHDAVWYLISLCSSSGVVLQKAEPSSPSSSDSNNDGGNDFFAAEPIRLELRDTHPIFEEQQLSFSNTNPGPSASLAFGTATTNGFATGIASSATGIYTSAATSTQSAHKDSTALGLGLGLSIGLLSLAGGLFLGIWFIRERKKEKAAAQASQQQYPGGQPGMVQQQQQPVVVAPGAGPYKQSYNQPAELSQNAQYMGNEMPTHGGNTAEMAAPYHLQAGYNPALQQQQQQQQQGAYIQPHPIHPQQQTQYYPHHGTPSPAPQVYHEVPAQHAGPGSPAPIPAHTPVQQHQHAPATGTGRPTTPNLYE